MRNESPRRGQNTAGADATDYIIKNKYGASAPQKQEHAVCEQSIDETACSFYRLILPDPGPYATFIIERRGRRYNRFADTVEELWTYSKEADQAGHAAYHACASFKTAQHDPKGTPHAQRRLGRTKHNVCCAKSFWLDVDAGENKPYRDSQAAEEAVDSFCRSTGLPPPLIVESGFGIHAYWPLLKPLEPDTWERYASGLKSLCDRHGLLADHSRTTDITSILRTPGTHHRKSGERLVVWKSRVEPYDIDRLAVLLANDNSRKRSACADSLGPLPEFMQDYKPFVNSSEMLSRLLTGTFRVSSAPLVANRCGQLAEFRNTRGVLPEPLWYAGLGVLGFCKDGDFYGHEWSKGDPRYSERMTCERLARVRQLSGATKCEKFHELNSSICERCPSWGKIRSPIVLGHEDPSASHQNRSSNESEDSKQPEQDQAGGADSGRSNANGDSTRGQGAQGDAKEKTNRTPYTLRWHGESDPNANHNWLVKNLLPCTGAGLVSGQWGTGKTFIALDLALAVMMGEAFAGRSNRRKGGVLFIAAEGASEIPIRLQGLVEAKYPNFKARLPFAWSEDCPILLEKEAITKLEQIAKHADAHMKAEFGVELVLIFIDTMSAAAGFKDENAASEGQIAMNVLNDLSKRTGALVLACDHFGKAVDNGTRGSSAKEAAADVVIACLGDKSQNGRTGNLRMAVRKLRGGPTGAETAFSLREVDMGRDEDGDPITTCVVDWSPVTISASAQTAKGAVWPKGTDLFRSALLTAIKQHGLEVQPLAGQPPVRAVELDIVREEFNKRYSLDSDDREKQLNARRQKFKRSTDTAQMKGLIDGREIDGKYMVWLTRPQDEGVEPSGGSSGQKG